MLEDNSAILEGHQYPKGKEGGIVGELRQVSAEYSSKAADFRASQSDYHGKREEIEATMRDGDRGLGFAVQGYQMGETLAGYMAKRAEIVADFFAVNNQGQREGNLENWRPAVTALLLDVVSDPSGLDSQSNLRKLNVASFALNGHSQAALDRITQNLEKSLSIT